MERVIELLFDHVLKEICGEGERRIKLQALSVALSAVLGTRKLILLIFFYCFSCFLAALSFIAAAFLLTEQYMGGAFHWLDPRLDLSVVLFLVSSSVLFFSVREKNWAGAFGIQEKINEIERENARGGFSEADMVRLIERVLDARDAAKEARVTRPSGPDQAA